MSVSYSVVLACLSGYGMLSALQSERFSVSCLTENGAQTPQIIAQTRPDLLALDFTLPGLDAPGILAALSGMRLCSPPRVLLFVPDGAAWAARAQSLCVDAALAVPASPDAVQAAALTAMARPVGALAAPHMPLRLQAARALLDELRMPPGLKGYGYLADAAARITAAPWLAWELTARVYPALAEKANSTPAAVERCIRHAVESTWLSGDLAALHALFGASVDPDKGKPTNGETLAQLCEHARNRLRAQTLLY